MTEEAFDQVSEIKSGRLLVVDDEAETLGPLLDIASEWGFEAIGCSTGEEALQVLKDRDFDLLLTDLMMPGMDGIGLLKAAIEEKPNLVCIVITGKGTVQTAVEAMKVGAFDYVLKPLDFKMLRMILTRAEELARLRQSEERYRSIVEDQTEFICRCLPDGTITFANEVLCRYFGLSCGELAGKTMLPFIMEEDREKLVLDMASLNPEKPVSIFEHRVILPGEEIRWHQWTHRALFDDRGHISEILSVGRDVSDRKRAEEALLKSRERLRALAVRLAEIEEAERKKIARELHDMVGQNLTALGINLNIIESQIPREAAEMVTRRVRDSLSLVEQTALCIRDVMAELRPEVLDDYGLLAALRWYGKRFSERTGLAVSLHGEALRPRLALTSEIALFRIVQEALTNVVKHAGAGKVTIELEEAGDYVKLTISDDGKGFDPSALPHAEGHTGWGLMTMEERAIALDGNLSIESGQGRGTRIAIKVKR